MSEEPVPGDTLDKLIDKNSPLKITKKKILNEPNPKLSYYVKPPYPILKKKPKKETFQTFTLSIIGDPI